MKLRISKRSRFFAALLYHGGIALLIGSIPIAAVAPELVPVVMIAGAMAGFAGALWINRLYRCPQCGKELLGRNWESFTMPPLPLLSQLRLDSGDRILRQTINRKDKRHDN